ncbi:tetratricopeptide repeat protein [Geoalkalibacter halelectricus]|uniref:Tetratricopeptide repeat-containing protein n=1 Tax=Geoalkalibacter halelectricus TaxID=2847045 RepID=A0ABY5ZRJ0_9BACT|nr:hypothetical protein [Geoalkalibacter halelectricus]MDO3376910.1 hypothetical protein [Geoalkalibacter halelectricus]UWZ81134.1 hypothetical protein L9S41_06990 [Geoalkalibacter halelectricus]
MPPFHFAFSGFRGVLCAYRRRATINWTLAAAIALLAGCGGESSSVDIPVAGATHVLSGYVEDGPVADALVTLRFAGTDQVARLCGQSGRGECRVKSDDDGFFSLRIHAGAYLPGLLAVAQGGIDRDTGVDFSAIEMRAALSQFEDQPDAVAITPLTTLLAAQLDRGSPLAEAAAQLRLQLALPADADLGARPSNDETLQHRALLLTKIALESNQQDSLRQILTDLDGQALFSFNGRLSETALQHLTLLQVEGRERVRELENHLASAPGYSWGETFQRLELHRALTDNLALMLTDDATLDPDDERFLANAELFSKAVFAATAHEGIVLSAPAPQRIVRYALFAYGLNNLDTFLLPPDEFAARLTRVTETGPLHLKNDPEIPHLAQSRVRYNLVVPLLEGERLTSEARRIEYFYNSDVSPFYRAERLLAGLNDADLSDAVMLRILEGKARNGLLADARTIAETQIVQTVNRGLGFTTLGDILAEQGRIPEAGESLRQARVQFLRVMAAKGWASITNQDAAHFQKLSSAFRRAGDFSAAREVLDDLEQAAPHLSTAVLFSRLFIGTRNIADEHIERGELALAADLVAAMHDFARRTPANETAGIKHYKARIFNLTETARRYADMDDQAGAWQVYQEVMQLRRNDGLAGYSKAESWVYMRSLADTLFQISRREEAMDLALSIPDSYVDAQGITRSSVFHRNAALKSAAAALALEEGIVAAESFIQQHFPDLRDQIEAWTYFAGNRTTAFVAEQALQQERLDLAHEALLKARPLVAQLQESTDQNRYRYIIQWGYAKLADLAWRGERPALARALLEDAEDMAWTLGDVVYLVAALVDIARVYDTLEQPDQAQAVLEDALAAVGLHRQLLTTRNYLDLQQKILDAFQDFVAEPLEGFIAAARDLFTPGKSYPGTEHDDLAKLQAEALIDAADILALFGHGNPDMLERARALLDEARRAADAVYVPATRMGLYINTSSSKRHLIGAYARARDFATAEALTRALPYRGERHRALETLATIYCEWDDLPHMPSASVDTDGDGRPNFFHPWATEVDRAGWELDPDSDGDGIPDHLDPRPLYPG